MEEKLEKKTSKKVNKQENIDIAVNNQINQSILNVLKEIKILLIAVVCILVFISVISLVTNKKISKDYSNDNKQPDNGDELGEYDVSTFDEITADDLIELYKKDGYHIIYTGRSTCGYCVMFAPVLKEIQEKYDVKINYLDITKVDNAGYETIKKEDNLLTQNFGTTPLTIVYKDGEFVDGIVGYVEYEAFESFLEKTGMIKKEA